MTKSGITPWMAAIAIVALQATTSSQSGMPPRIATDVTKADFDRTLARAPGAGVMDQQIRVVDIGAYNVAVGVLHRAAKAKHTAIAHAQVTEVYHILQGSGTLVTGGTIVDATAVPSDSETHKVLVGPSTTGPSISNGQSRRVSPGDVIVIPPGVAHWFAAVDADMNYLVVRVDGNHVLPAGYVNTAIKP
jgi:mannose-6-phosphate isomerase-like protein (cupin superfamily)